jgi:hypothetical protein
VIFTNGNHIRSPQGPLGPPESVTCTLKARLEAGDSPADGNMGVLPTNGTR